MITKQFFLNPFTFVKTKTWIKDTLLVLALVLGSNLALDLFIDSSGDEEFTQTINLIYNTWGMTGLLIIVAGIGPLIEEILFRSWLFHFLKWVRIPVVGSIILCAALFGAMHTQYSFIVNTQIVFTGLLLGWLALKCKSFIPGVIVHGINNAIGVLFFVNT